MDAPSRTLARTPRTRAAVPGGPAAAPGSPLLVLALFAATAFTSASLLFLVQPMVAKMVLPLLGGTPAVWNTCMVFFQVLLLAGYAYAHAAPARLGVRRQAALHASLLLVPLAVLPITIGAARLPSPDADPVAGILRLLLLTTGLPFFVLAATAPLLQRWLSATRHPSARDPYALYAASNLGSMVALLSYPVLIEPRLRLGQQSRAWAIGYGVFAALVAACAAWTWWSARGRPAATPAGGPSEGTGATPSPADEPRRTSLGEALQWTALAFVPSSLMLGVTTYFTSEIAAIPLFWVVPLALYLGTFVLAFSGALRFLQAEIRVWLPVLVTWLCFSMLTRLGMEIWVGIPLHLAAFFLAALLCHGELARRRPPAARLTTFYLCMSLGGALGGIFNAIVAPQVFLSVAEYPLAMVLALLFVPAVGEATSKARAPLRRRLPLDLLVPAGIGILALAVLAAAPARDLEPAWLGPILTYGPLLLVCFALVRRPATFALALGAVLGASAMLGGRQEGTLVQERNFFGVLRVAMDPEGRYVQLFHGTTLHGQQAVDPARKREPLTYYHPSGPIGQVFRVFSGSSAKDRVALIGLGTGSLLAYGEPGQTFTAYEIDPAVVHLASDPRYFTFLRDSRARVEVVLGDARLRLAEPERPAYGLIVVDAFSSDAIPIHLITREALRLYLSRLEPGGVVAFHISSRYLRLETVLAALAGDAGLLCRLREDPADDAVGKASSRWVVMARSESDLGPLARDARWRPIPRDPRVRVWTDDFSDPVRVLEWGLHRTGRETAGPSGTGS